MSSMRRNNKAPHIGRGGADKAAEMGPALRDAPISYLAQFNYSFNSSNPDARTGSAKKRLGPLESDLNQGYNSKNKLGGTPVRVIDKKIDSYNE